MSSSVIIYILSAATCFIASCCNYDEQFIHLCPVKHQNVLGDVISASAADPSSSSVNSSGCQCTALAEIRCRGLRAVPKFNPVPPTTAGTPPMFCGLYMFRQSIPEVPRSAFASLRVRKIVLSFNPIDDRLSEESFDGVAEDLHELDIGGCRLRNLPEGLLRDMHRLEYLHLWGNSIEAIPRAFFRDTVELSELLLWGNLLEDLDGETFEGLTRLRRLDLDQNLIRTLSRSAFRHLRHLQVLHLGHNRIHAISYDVFQDLRSLRVLKLNGNGLGFINAAAFDSLVNLSILSLSHNRINLLPDEIFVKLGRLSVLLLHNNILAHAWRKTFDGLRSLHFLGLSHNRLTSLPKDVLRASTRLKHLFLEDNLLKTVRRCTLSGATRLRTLALTGNPIQCDCRLLWVVFMFSGERDSTVWGACSDLDNPRPNIVSGLSRRALSECQSASNDISSQFFYCSSSGLKLA